MREFVVIFLIISVISCEPEGYKIPDIKFEALKSGGFRSVIPDFPGMNTIIINANINKAIGLNEPGMLLGEAAKGENNFRIIEFNKKLKIGDVINYWIFISNKPWSFRKDGLSWEVTELKDSYSVLSSVDVPTSSLLNVRFGEN